MADLTQPFIILGDLNIHVDDQKYEVLNTLLCSHGMRQLIMEETTNNHTTIDLIFTNIEELSVRSGVLESYYSHHKPVWISVDVNKL